ncbi:proline reductase-associated electron transfer protein PrdC [Enterococcus sp. 669A]|uniref:Proline reductase-associated electron transfer protein PrdC n=2 Tax=Candidatus Enterococcus moelleringii TaxID=2815325 RepID=A0ABS3L950_9ENTE|nr:proline reductase-associated electron transfer protein PrdC [Enterococcus sp. 669A]
MTQILIPLKQHVGAPCRGVVKAGEMVKRGQLVAEPNGLGANIHSSFSGKVVDVSEENVVLMIDEEQDFSSYVPIPDTDTMIKAVEEAGVVGAGGAGFPTFLKLACEIPEGLIIANGAECEALLAHNVKQMSEHIDQLIRGIKYCMEMTQAPRGVIAVKAKHRQLVMRMLKAVESEANIDIYQLPDIYPAGDERMIVREVMDVILEPGQIPIEVGAVVDNVETIKRIVEAIEDRKPFIDKDVTVSGRVKQKETVFVDVPIGTPVKTLINNVGGYVEPHGEIVIGGPMTGRSGEETTPITKTSGGVLVAMPFPQEHRKVGLLICECGGSAERMTEIVNNMGAEVVAAERCKRMVEVNGRYRCALPGICPGQAQTVLALKKQGAEVVMTGSCSD